MTSRLNQKNKWNTALTVILTVLLAAFIGLVFYVNLSCNPEFYDGDMYSDINYAKEAWKAKSLFPKTWSFGNQTYVVATPVVAALIYGITKNAITAMAIASCIMTVLTVLTYDWMMKPVCRYNERTAGFLFTAAFILIKAHIALDDCGAQLLFTMASYYACYVITAFLVYGCYIRIREKSFKKKSIPILLISIGLSFGTGMQSLRQTVIMVLPLVAVELLLIIIDSVRTKKVTFTGSTAYAALISVANISGVIAVKFIDYNQTTIYGNVSLKHSFSQVISTARNSVCDMLENLGVYYVPQTVVWVLKIALIGIILFAVALSIKDLAKNKCKQTTDFSIIMLLLCGCLGVLFAALLTNMKIRPIYYIMIFPLLSVSVAFILRKAKNRFKSFLCILLILFVVSSITFKCVIAYKDINSGKSSATPIYQAEEYIAKNGYDTVCSLFVFSGAEGIAVASRDNVKVLYFNKLDSGKVFTPIKYLCVKDAYKNIDSDKCLYLVNKTEFELYAEAAHNYEVEFEKVAEFGEQIVLCKASDNLLVIADEAQKEN